jgi:hypothetical protein
MSLPTKPLDGTGVLRARGFAAQQTEAAIGVAVLNRMLAAGRPDSVRRQPVIAQPLGIGIISPWCDGLPDDIEQYLIDVVR